MIISAMPLSMLLGTAIGIVLGLTGAGGGVLAVPALMLGFGMSLTSAAPVALVAVGLGALVGTLSGLRRGQVRYRAAMVMAASGAVCAPAGIWLAHQASPTWLTLAFCAVMVWVALRMMRQVLAAPGVAACDTGARHRCVVDVATGRFKWDAKCATTLLGIGGLAGLFTGMLGVGGGFIIVPALRQWSNLTMPASSATSLAVITLVSLSTVAGTLSRGVAIPAVGWVFIAMTALGMLAGRALVMRLPARRVQLFFAMTVLLVAAGMFVKAVF